MRDKTVLRKNFVRRIEIINFDLNSLPTLMEELIIRGIGLDHVNRHSGYEVKLFFLYRLHRSDNCVL